MKSNELRIGNKLKKGGVVITVDAQTIVKIDDLGSAAGYEPIPITPEWLEKFGLTKIETTSGRYKYLNGYYKFGECYLMYLVDYCSISTITYSNEDEVDVSDVLFVHQLQNLYFALTNEELTMKN